MSFDVYLEYPAIHVEDYNPTFNYRDMIDAALEIEWDGSLQDEGSPLYNLPFSEALPMFKKGLERLKEDSRKFRALEPANGWGTYHGLIDLFTEWIAIMEEHPDGRMKWGYHD